MSEILQIYEDESDRLSFPRAYYLEGNKFCGYLLAELDLNIEPGPWC